ncbi:MAG TPA: hypothetical protein VEG39_01815 [Clostridia bacterium]|nr:hypothetical protein [Clostridia bacterium]
MQYFINTDEPAGITWGAKGNERILQNVVNLINTSAYEVAYARTVGIQRDFYDLPAPQAAAVAANSIREVIALREPRATVENVEYLGVTKSGSMKMRVVVDI